MPKAINKYNDKCSDPFNTHTKGPGKMGLRYLTAAVVQKCDEQHGFTTDTLVCGGCRKKLDRKINEGNDWYSYEGSSQDNPDNVTDNPDDAVRDVSDNPDDAEGNVTDSSETGEEIESDHPEEVEISSADDGIISGEKTIFFKTMLHLVYG